MVSEGAVKLLHTPTSASVAQIPVSDYPIIQISKYSLFIFV